MSGSLAKLARPDMVLESDRLRLRAVGLGDLDALLRLAGDPEVARWTSGIPHPYHHKDAISFLTHAEEKFRRGDAFAFAVEKRSNGALIGGADLRPWNEGEVPSLELGYWIAREEQGQGFASEATRRVIEFALDELGCQQIIAIVMTENKPSIRVLEKLKFRLKRRDEEYWERRDAAVRVARYALQARDFSRPR